MRVVEHSSRPAVLGFVSSTLQWQFQYHPAYTVVTGLEADRLATGMTVVAGLSWPELSVQAPEVPGFRRRIDD